MAKGWKEAMWDVYSLLKTAAEAVDRVPAYPGIQYKDRYESATYGLQCRIVQARDVAVALFDGSIEDTWVEEETQAPDSR